MAAEDSDYDELSPAEKARVGAHFILSSPPGEIDEVTKDMKVITGGALGEEKIAESYATYNAEHLVTVPLPEGGHMVLSVDGRIDDSHFIDTHGKKVYGVDHVSRTVNAEDVRDVDGELDASVEEQREAVLTSLKGYIETHFLTEESRGVEVYAKDGNLRIVMSGVTTNVKNKWGCSWRSWWTVDVAGNTLSGNVRVLSHYYEDGNVQLHSNKEFTDVALKVSDATPLGKAVKSAIFNCETDLENGMLEAVSQMGATALQDVRRMLPVSKKPMDWNVNAHRMRNSLSRK